MMALVYEGQRQLDIKKVMKPIPGSHQVLIRVAYCGVCGTDIHIYKGEGGAFDVTPPLIMGHEFSGFVEEVGDQVTGIKPGQLVSADPNNTCGSCYYCRNGKAQFCRSITGTGTTVDGGFAEYCLVDEKQVYVFGQETDPVEAAMAEPLSCCIHGIDLCQIQAGERVLIVGGGPIGLMMVQLARLSGAAKVILSEPVEGKRIKGLELGADEVVDPFDPGSRKTIEEEFIDVVIECVGKPQTIVQSMQWAGHGGRILLFGLTGPDIQVPLDTDMMFKKELKILTSFINPYTFQRAVDLIESGKVQMKGTIGHIVSLEDSAGIFCGEYGMETGKIIVKI